MEVMKDKIPRIWLCSITTHVDAFQIKVNFKPEIV